MANKQTVIDLYNDCYALYSNGQSHDEVAFNLAEIFEHDFDINYLVACELATDVAAALVENRDKNWDSTQVSRKVNEVTKNYHNRRIKQ